MNSRPSPNFTPQQNDDVAHEITGVLGQILILSFVALRERPQSRVASRLFTFDGHPSSSFLVIRPHRNNIPASQLRVISCIYTYYQTPNCFEFEFSEYILVAIASVWYLQPKARHSPLGSRQLHSSMSRSKYGQSSLAGLVDSDEDEEQFMSGMPTPESGVENMAPAKKGRGIPKAAPAKITKIKAPARRTSGRLNAKTKANAPVETKGKRKALADKTNQQYASDTEEVEEFEQNDTSMDVDELENKAVTVKPTKPKTTKKTAAGRGKITKEVSHTNYSIDEVTPDAPRLEARVAKKKASAKEMPEESSPEKVVHETQAVDVGGYGDEEVEETVPKRSHSTARHRSVSRPRQPSVPRRRAGSASDTERSDPALRRKLGEMTKKYDALNIKYQDLREIGLKEAERNFDRLKKQSEEKTKSISEGTFTASSG